MVGDFQKVYLWEVAGIYFHIPFCSQACSYCNFHFSTSLNQKSTVLECMEEEVRLNSGRLPLVETIYFGGGTPSVLMPEEIDRLINLVNQHFDTDLKEVTVEANPEDLTSSFCQAMKSVGVDRFSIGVQSFFDEDLQPMNRIHSADEAHAAIENAEHAGFRRLNIDLIYGLPWSPESRWQENLEILSSKNIHHLSAYALTIEEKTALAYQIAKGLQPPMDDERAFRDFSDLQIWCRQNGWRHYEISNLSHKGAEAVHNTSYWTGDRYIGIGPAAHSYDGAVRQWNVSNNAKYIRGIQEGTPYYETESLSKIDRFNELVMTGLRLDHGVELARIRDLDEALSDQLLKEAQPKIDAGLLLLRNDRLALVDDQRFFADGHASDLFIVVS